MKFVCKKSDLLKGVNIVLKAVPSKTTMSILECILIDASAGQIKMTANDMELGIETVIEGDIQEKGIIAIDAKMEEQSVSIDLSGENMGIVIGKRGDTLNSLQYRSSLVVNQRSDDYIKVSIDTENYREKRAEALLALSTRLADKVTKTGKKFTLEPMNPYERRIIHSNLQDSETVTTYSVGSEPYRKVVIAPKNAKPYGKGGYKKDGYKKRGPKPHRNHSDKPVAEKTGSYTTTYKADFKPQQHKAEYKNFEDYLAGHSDEFKGEE